VLVFDLAAYLSRLPPPFHSKILPLRIKERRVSDIDGIQAAHLCLIIVVMKLLITKGLLTKPEIRESIDQAQLMVEERMRSLPGGAAASAYLGQILAILDAGN